MAQHPGDRQLRQTLPTRCGDFVERGDLPSPLGRYLVRLEKAVRLRRPGASRYVAQIPIGEEALREGREHDATDPLLREHVEQPILDPPIEHAVARLVNETGRA